MFVDRVHVEVSGGRGGHGCISFRREKYVPRGGPDGGDGGDGGSVIFIAKAGVNSLVALASKHHIKAKSGKNGLGSGKHGGCADDTIVEVPPGTVVIDSSNGLIIKDLGEGESSFGPRNRGCVERTQRGADADPLTHRGIQQAQALGQPARC